LFTVGFCGGALMYYSLSADDKCLSPESVCGDLAPMTTGYYNVKKDISAISSTFWYSVNFEETNTVQLNSSKYIFGKMNVCTQSTGNMQPFAPLNCTLSYVYEAHSCKIDFLDSDCNKAVVHEHSDNTLIKTEFDSKNNQLFMSFSTHSHITGGTYVLNHEDQPNMKCDATKNDAPLQICPKTKLFEYLSR